MAVMAAIKSNIPVEKIIKVIKNIKPVDGRLEKIAKLNNNGMVILDYAHTPDALETCIKNIKDQFKFRKVNLVFGCGGERDKSKRKLMGKIANKYCNKIYLTDDNPRNENPKKIREDIKSNIANDKLLEIPLRENAIKTSILDIKSDEIVLLLEKDTKLFKNMDQKNVSQIKNISNCLLMKEINL